MLCQRFRSLVFFKKLEIRLIGVNLFSFDFWLIIEMCVKEEAVFAKGLGQIIQMLGFFQQLRKKEGNQV